MKQIDYSHLQKIVDEIIEPNAPIVDEKKIFPEVSIKALAQEGYLKLTVPKEFGGWEAKPTDVSKVIGMIAKACASTAMIYVMHLTSLNSLIYYCNENQRMKFLIPAVEEKWLITEAISEPGSGSQWWSLTSTARKLKNDFYHLQAKKSFVTSAGYADLYTVSTISPSSRNHKEHALFVVKGGTKGIQAYDWNGVGLIGNMSGAMEFDCIVESDCLLFGSESSDGLRLYNEANQPIYHLGVASVYAGIARSAYEKTIERVKSRKYSNDATVHGKNLSNYPIAQRHIGKMAIRLLQAESLVKELAQSMEEKESFHNLAVKMTAAKVAAAEAAFDITHESMLTSGGSSYIKGGMPLERYLRDALAASLMGPNDDFCKELIGKLALNLGTYHDL
jgi:alkylation response protein AidB-like acyl-CoA dehydrogenase